jgi:hypothetical protein
VDVDPLQPREEHAEPGLDAIDRALAQLDAIRTEVHLRREA